MSRFSSGAITSLFECLESGDVTVTSVDTDKFYDGYGIPLGKALRGNTVVTKIDLWICSLLSEQKLPARANDLLHWLEHSPALQTVQLRFDRTSLVEAWHLTRLTSILRALVRSQSLRVLKLYIKNTPVHVVSSLNFQQLQSFRFEVDMDTSPEEAQELLDAIQRMPKIECLSLQLIDVNPVLTALETRCTTLRELERNGSATFGAREFPLLANWVANATKFERLALVGKICITAGRWNKLWAKIKRSSLETLSLAMVSFVGVDAVIFKEDLGSRSCQPIRRLLLTDCNFFAWTPKGGERRMKGREVGSCIDAITRDSLMEHLTLKLDHATMQNQGWEALFSKWARRKREMRLRSLHLDVPRIKLAKAHNFLAGSVHLRELTLTIHDGVFRNGRMRLPRMFGKGLSQNGSLYRVVFCQEGYEWWDELAQKVTDRNKQLPEMIANIRTQGDADDVIQSKYHTVCVCAGQMQGMGPTHLLNAMLSAADLVGGNDALN